MSVPFIVRMVSLIFLASMVFVPALETAMTWEHGFRWAPAGLFWSGLVLLLHFPEQPCPRVGKAALHGAD